MTLVSFESLQERNLYTDLLREFIKNGHHVYAISPVEKRQNQATHLIEEENASILRLQIGNTQKTNIIEKGISTVRIEPDFIKAIKRPLCSVLSGPDLSNHSLFTSLIIVAISMRSTYYDALLK